MPSRGTRIHGVVTMLVALSSLALSFDMAASQQPANATVAGTIAAAGTGEPLAGIQVTLAGTTLRTVTNRSGEFRLTGVEPGRRVVEVTHPYRGPLAIPLPVEAGQTLNVAIRLEISGVPIAEVVVEGDAVRTSARMVGFHARRGRGTGMGHFVARADIDRRDPRTLSDMLRIVPGLVINCSGGRCETNSFSDRRRIRGPCPIQYFLDGVPFGGDVDDLAPDQVEGIEVYRGSASVPPEFNSGTAMCGVIAMWSRVPG